MKKYYCNNISSRKSSFLGLFGCIILAYSSLVCVNFLLETFLFYYVPGFHVYTDPEPAETVIEAAQQAKDETIQVVTRRPIQFTVVAVLCGLGLFVIFYGPWER